MQIFKFYNTAVPTVTEARIDELCAKIRVLCGGAHVEEREAELKELARELRVVINEHLEAAKNDLRAAQLLIELRSDHL